MPSIYLAPYSISLHRRGENAKLSFDSVFQNPDFVSTVHSYFDSLKTKFADDPQKNGIFRTSALEYSKDTIHGIIDSGEYGIESKFYDLGGNHKYDRKKDHAEVKPFYFMVHLPKQSDVGFLLLQRFGKYGIAQGVTTRLLEFLRKSRGGLIYEIEPIVSSKVLQSVLKDGRVRKTVFTKHNLSSDIANFMDKKARENAYMQLSFVAKRNQELSLGERLNKIVFGNGDENSLLKIRNFEFDEVKVVVDHKGAKRTVSLGDNKFRAYYDVTSEVKTDANGNPNFISIRKAATTIVKELQEMV